VRRSRTSLQGDEKGEGESKNRHPSLFMTWARVGHLGKNGSGMIILSTVVITYLCIIGHPCGELKSDCISVKLFGVSESLNWTARRKDFSGWESAVKAKTTCGFSRFSAWNIPKRKPQAFPKRKGPFRVHSWRTSYFHFNSRYCSF